MASKEAALALALLALAYRFWKKAASLSRQICHRLRRLAHGLFVLWAVVAGRSATLVLRMVSMRSLVSLVLFYFWGRLSFFDLRQMRYLVRFVVGLQVVVALFGIYEWWFLPHRSGATLWAPGPSCLTSKAGWQTRMW